MLYSDTRLGGTPRYILSEQEPRLMLVPDEIRRCVCFVGHRNKDGSVLLKGTAFFVSNPTSIPNVFSHFAVTAKHVINGIRDKGGSKVLLRLVPKGGGKPVWVDTPIAEWVIHPDIPEEVVDVAVLMGGFNSFDELHFPLEGVATDLVIQEEGIGVGNEVFMPGLFSMHYGEQKNIPIIRIGNIAAMPEEQVETKIGLMDAYLIEARSMGGLSGSPVFVHLGGLRNVDGKLRVYEQPHGIFYLLGLMHGHWDSLTNTATDRVNMGIGIVVPVSKILEVIEQPSLKKRVKKIEEEFRKQTLP